MKHFLILVLVIPCCFLYGQDSTHKSETIDFIQRANKIVGEQFGNFNLTAADQTTFSNANISDKIAFVNFWFESCPPCISELEGFNKLFDTLKDNRNFIFVSFTFDPDSTITKLKEKYNIKYKVYHIDRTECYRLNFNSGFPASFVLNKQGVIKYVTFGGFSEKEKATEQVMTQIYPKIVEQL